MAVLGVWTGCRMEEVGQLALRDVKCRKDIWYLDVTNLPDPDDKDDEALPKNLKNDDSNRMVPLHPAVLRAGFLDYVAARRREGGTELFPSLKPGLDGKRTQAFSKRFSRHIRGLGITYRGKVYHSFRHGFKTACRRARIEEEIHDALTGHSNGGIGRLYGDHEITTLAEAVAKLSIPGFPEDLRASA